MPAPDPNPLAEDLEHILRHTEGLWGPLRGESVFITGGTGFFGRWLLESFAHVNRALCLGAKAVVLSRDPARFQTLAPHLDAAAGIAFVQGDVRDFTVAKINPQIPPGWPQQHRFFIHAATEASAQLNAENPLLMLDTIVVGTRAALDFAIATGAKRFLLTSSGAVYGRQPSEITHVPEDYLGAPDCTQASSAYGEGKRLAELLCACYAQQHGLECPIARCFAFVGPFLPLDTHFAIGNFIRDALLGGPIKVNGDGTPHRSYLYAADLAIWLWTILFKGLSMRPYNVGSENDGNIGSIAETVNQALLVGKEIEIATKADPALLSSRYVPCVKRARLDLELKDNFSFSAGISKTAAYLGAFSKAAND